MPMATGWKTACHSLAEKGSGTARRWPTVPCQRTAGRCSAPGYASPGRLPDCHDRAMRRGTENYRGALSDLSLPPREIGRARNRSASRCRTAR